MANTVLDKKLALVRIFGSKLKGTSVLALSVYKLHSQNSRALCQSQSWTFTPECWAARRI